MCTRACVVARLDKAQFFLTRVFVFPSLRSLSFLCFCSLHWLWFATTLDGLLCAFVTLLLSRRVRHPTTAAAIKRLLASREGLRRGNFGFGGVACGRRVSVLSALDERIVGIRAPHEGALDAPPRCARRGL